MDAAGFLCVRCIIFRLVKRLPASQEVLFSIEFASYVVLLCSPCLKTKFRVDCFDLRRKK